MALGLRFSGGGGQLSLAAKRPLLGHRRVAFDDSAGFVAGASINGRSVHGGTWTNAAATAWTADGWIKRMATGFEEYGFLSVLGKTVRAKARMRRMSAAGNGFLMVMAEAATDPATYLLGGHSKADNEYQIWTRDAGTLTKRAFVANTWDSGERSVEFSVTLVPGGTNPKKIVCRLFVDGEAVLVWSSESGIPAGLGSKVGIWMDNTTAGGSPTDAQSVQFRDLEIYDGEHPCALVALGDSITVGTGSSVPATKNHAALAGALLGWTVDNRAVGASLVADVRGQAEAAIGDLGVEDRAVAVVMAGTNDLDRGGSVGQALADLRSVCLRLRESGLFRGVGVHTLLPGRTATGSFNGLRGAFNDQLVTRYREFCDGVSLVGFDPVVGVDSAPYVPDTATGTTGTFVDALHPNDHGQRMVARYTADLAMRVGGE